MAISLFTARVNWTRQACWAVLVPASLRHRPYADICRPRMTKASSRTTLSRIPTPAIAVAAADPCGRAVRPRLARAAPSPAVEVVPLWGFACGAATGCVIGVLAAFSGGPLGSGRLAAVGPSGWQAAVVAVLEVGVAAAVAAGLANWLRVRRDPVLAAERARRLAPPRGRPPASPDSVDDGGHRIYLDPRAGAAEDRPAADRPSPGPSMLP